MQQQLSKEYLYARPEWLDAKGVRTVYGISRSHAYELGNSGQIRTVSIRRRGAARGRRLFDCDSIRRFLDLHAVQVEPPVVPQLYEAPAASGCLPFINQTGATKPASR